MRFSFLDKTEKAKWMPKLFDLLHENMQEITPSDLPYEQQFAAWSAAVSPALEREPRKILMCFDDGELVGFLQYYINDRLLMVEELQLKRELQRTNALYAFCKYLLSALPHDLQIIEAYADRRNQASIRLMNRLGMFPCEEKSETTFVHLRGSASRVYHFFRRDTV